ncbi:hypothetical protein [Kribbella sp. NPDC051137]|uniref:hypothetical protein n=1 Tax=Kribbella sp. NPDC051137 TaxID=3155045 RepID=UPI0034422F3C
MGFSWAALAGDNLSDAVANDVVPAVNAVCRAEKKPIGVWFVAVPVWIAIVAGFTVFWPHVEWWTLWGAPSGSTADPTGGGEQVVFVLCALLAPTGILLMPLLLPLFVAMPGRVGAFLAVELWA